MRRALAVGVVGLWILVSLVRVSRIVEAPAPPPGQELAPSFDFFRSTIPRDGGYLYVLPGEFGQDNGDGPRLRYELYPRLYDDVRASLDESSVRQLMQREGLRYVVVPDARQYATDHWVRASADWQRTELDPDTYVLERARAADVSLYMHP